MAKKDLDPGSIIKLTKQSGEIIDGEYTVVKVMDKHSIKVISAEGISLNVHKNRVVKQEEEPEQGKEKQMSDKKVETKVKKEKTKKEKVAPTPFDAIAWAKETGNVHLVKENKFDHASHQCHTHMVIDNVGGYYFTLNVYTYPDGTQSLGKKPKEASKYPLKGKKITKTVTNKDGETEKKVNIGKETAHDCLKRALKKGYVVKSGELPPEPEKAKKAEKKVEKKAEKVEEKAEAISA